MSFFLSLSLLLLFFFSLLLLLSYLIYTSFFHPGPVYYPSSGKAISKMIKLSRVGKGDTVMDLGSGDGRILIEFAKRGAKAIGFEIDPILVLESRRRIKKLGLSHLAKVHFKSFWNADFNQATIITVYLFPKYMDRLQEILEKNLTHPILVVSNDYQFPRKGYFQKLGKVYLYKFP